MKTDQFLLEFKVNGVNPKSATRDTYGYVLRPLDDFLISNNLEIEALGPKEFEMFLSLQNWGNSHQRTALFATRTYLRFEGFDPIKNPHRLHELKIAKEEPMNGRTPRYDQFKVLLEVSKESRLPIMAARNSAILWTMWHTLIRASEVCRVELAHVDLPNRNLQVRTKAKAGKPRAPQTKRLFPESIEAIHEWLDVRGEVATSGMTDKLFVSQSINTEGQLTRAGLQALFNRLGDAAGFKVSPHDLRRGGACYMIEQGVPARLVKEQGGWKSWDVFNRYTAGAQLSAMDAWLAGEQQPYLAPAELQPEILAGAR